MFQVADVQVKIFLQVYYPKDLACFAVLSEDFKAAGHEVTVLLDARLSKLNPPIDADRIVPIFYPYEPKKKFTSIAKVNDAIYVLAPETGQTLQSFVKLAEQTGKNSLNCESQRNRESC